MLYVHIPGRPSRGEETGIPFPLASEMRGWWIGRLSMGVFRNIIRKFKNDYNRKLQEISFPNVFRKQDNPHGSLT